MKNIAYKERQLIARRLKIILSNSGASRKNRKCLDGLITKTFFRRMRPAGTTLTHHNMRTYRLYYIRSGVVRLCVEMEKGNLYTLSFFSEDQIVFIPFYEVKKEFYRLTLRAVTNCTIWSAELENFKKQIGTCNDLFWDYLEMHFLQEFIEIVSMREYFCQVYNAEERYDLLLNDNRDLKEKVPDKMLASYIGVSPTTFSRLKTMK